MKIDEKLLKVMGIAAGGLVILIIFIALIASCSKKKVYTIEEIEELETKLISLAKDYYSINEAQLPKEGNNAVLSINSLVENNKIKPLNEIIENGESCSGQIIVYNNNGYYLYLPKIDCGSLYKPQTLSDILTKEENIVTTGNGLYQMNNGYIFRGETINNYLSFANKTWLIIGVNTDGTVKIMETTKRESTVWDDRYNEEKNYNSGINDFTVNDINSRIKDVLDEIYNNPEEFSDSAKAYFIKQNLCIGKRGEEDTQNDGTIECSQTLNDQIFGLIQVNEYLQASLDPNCLGTLSDSCTNYNYLANLPSSVWTITADRNTSYKAYKISNNMNLSNSSSSASVKAVALLTKEALVRSGTGTIDDPYTLVQSVE